MSKPGPNVLTREQFLDYLATKVEDRMMDVMAQAARQMDRWDAYHAGNCKCPKRGPHGVRLNGSNWKDEARQEADDHESYGDFDDIRVERGL